MIDLPDVNLWVALVDQRHVHHSLAQDYWNHNGTTQFAFCRVTMMGFLRVATSPKAISHPKTHAEGWAIYQQLRALPNIQFLSEPPSLEAYFQALSTKAALPTASGLMPTSPHSPSPAAPASSPSMPTSPVFPALSFFT